MRMMWLWKFMGRFYPERMREEFRRMSGIVVLERIVGVAPCICG